MKSVKCKPYVRFTPKEMNPNCYAYRGSHYKSFAVYEIIDFKWKLEWRDRVTLIKEWYYRNIDDTMYKVWDYFYFKGWKRTAKIIAKLREKLAPMPPF